LDITRGNVVDIGDGELGTLSATDADAGDTFTYTSSNTTFTLDNNKLKLNAALDYETSTSLSTLSTSCAIFNWLPLILKLVASVPLRV
jgi:hypothetical protein